LAAKRVATLAHPSIIEAVVYEFVERGYYDTHLRRLQAELDLRYRACLDALSALMPDGVRWTTPGGGLVLWLELPRRVDLHNVTERLGKVGVSLDARLNEWFFGEPHLHGTRINYAQESVERTRVGLELLAQEIRRELN
jgi:2-aminoadipate transaminase